ncbi:hypothetical protein [Streptomyces griseosporeus]|uniref:hypothetical protein n=1 Tax=Streptomyces griseosporeus TaxID=1910 RepID=UPI00167F036B|nr:hypothetical protein [Streptomyces griseosporeus]GHF53514.1 hypothetical protein GCM10018783_22970 [Streptomyces griseosporeus]
MERPSPAGRGALRARTEATDVPWSGTPIYAGLVREWRARGRTVPARADAARLPRTSLPAPAPEDPRARP